MCSLCPTVSISSLQSAHDLDAICVSCSFASCGMRTTPRLFFFFFFARGRKNWANDGSYFPISLQPVASLKTFGFTFPPLHSIIPLYTVSLSVYGIKHTELQIQSGHNQKWLCTPPHEPLGTISTSRRTSMESNKLNAPLLYSYCTEGPCTSLWLIYAILQQCFVFSSDTTVLYSVELLPWLSSGDAVWNWPRASWTDVVADE